MLRCSTRVVFINRNEVARFGNLNISRHTLCSQVSDNGEGGGVGKSEEKAPLQSPFKASSRNKVSQATGVLAEMAEMKRSKTISEEDYKSDKRFKNIIKLLETDVVNNTEPLSLVKGLKVNFFY